nr:hypothetical protein [Tanacetum cinerariifolium]
ESGSDMSAVMMGMLLGYDGWAQFKACASLDGFLPAKAKVLRGELLLLVVDGVVTCFARWIVGFEFDSEDLWRVLGASVFERLR